MSHRKHHLTVAGFILPLFTGTASWKLLGEPGHLPGLVACLGALVLFWPVVAMVFWSSPSGLVALVTTNQQRARYRKRRKDAGKGRSAPIRSWVHSAVIRADRKRCVFCHKTAEETGASLQADHFRPYAGGGLSWIFNLFSLCAADNQIKSSYWVDSDGYVHYRPYGRSDVALAAKILAAERRHKRNPLRWLRAAWSLAW